MALEILGRTVDKTLIIDDQPEARDIFAKRLKRSISRHSPTLRPRSVRPTRI